MHYLNPLPIINTSVTVVCDLYGSMYIFVVTFRFPLFPNCIKYIMCNVCVIIIKSSRVYLMSVECFSLHGTYI